MKRALLVLLLPLACPAPASAAGFGELPFRAVPAFATCLTAPGPAGMVTRTSPSAVELLGADATGLRPLGAAPLPALLPYVCPAVAVAGSGAAVVVAPVLDPYSSGPHYEVTAVVRDAGGAWRKPQVVTAAAELETSYAGAVSERGDAALAVTTSVADGGPFRLLVARRAPGGAFAAPVTLLTTAKGDREPAVRLGYAAGGELVAAWTRSAGRRFALDVAIAPPDGPFGPPQRIATVAPDPPGLAVAPDGRALLAFVAGGRVQVAERAAGGPGFGAPVAVGPVTDLNGEDIAPALGPGGAAAVAWQGVLDRGVTVAARPAAGPFGAPVVLAPADTGPMVGDETGPGSGGDPIDGRFAEDDLFGGRLGVALAGGQAAVSWPQKAVSHGLAWRGVRAATLSLAGGPATVQRLGSPLRDIVSETPLALADGRPGVAWADAGGGDGRLHLALASAPALPAAAAPRLRIGRPLSRVVRGDAALRLPVRCSAACDVRAQTAFEDTTLSLPRRGSGIVRISLGGVRLGRRRVQLLIAHGAPGSARPALRRVSVRVRHLRSRANA
jgi:hypothetical protein